MTKKDTILYFCDESSHIGHEYMGIGGICIKEKYLPELESQLASIKSACRWPYTVKWEKVCCRNDNPFKLFANTLCDLSKEGKVDFHLVFQKNGDWDHNFGLGEQKGILNTVSKAYYQLFLHRLIFQNPNSKIKIIPDAGAPTRNLNLYLQQLNTEGRKKYQAIQNIVSSIKPADEENCLPLQLLDVSLGAFTALKNKKILEGAKADLANKVYRMWGEPDLKQNTSMEHRALNILNKTPTPRAKLERRHRERIIKCRDFQQKSAK